MIFAELQIIVLKRIDIAVALSIQGRKPRKHIVGQRAARDQLDFAVLIFAEGHKNLATGGAVGLFADQVDGATDGVAPE